MTAVHCCNLCSIMWDFLPKFHNSFTFSSVSKTKEIGNDFGLTIVFIYCIIHNSYEFIRLNHYVLDSVLVLKAEIMLHEIRLNA